MSEVIHTSEALRDTISSVEENAIESIKKLMKAANKTKHVFEDDDVLMTVISNERIASINIDIDGSIELYPEASAVSYERAIKNLDVLTLINILGDLENEL